jgi:hypothetical protein
MDYLNQRTEVKSKNNTTFSDDEPCRNCGTHLEDRYCPHCGQDRLTGRQHSFGRMVINLCTSIFTFDDKVWVTIRKLLFRPGFLSKEYVSGRVMPYTLPIKLFWMMVLIFTIVFSFHDTSSSVVLTPKDGKSCQQQTEIVQNENVIAEKIAEDIVVAEEVVLQEPEQQRKIASDYFQYLPYFMLLVIPIFTALLALFFRKEKYAFSEHLIFAIHLHTIFFFLFTIEILVASYLLHDSDPTILIFLLLMGLYSLLSAIKFYHTRRKRSVIWRMLLIGLLYFIVLFALLIFVMILLGWFFDIKGIYVNM